MSLDLRSVLLATTLVSCTEPPAPTFTDQIDHRFAPIVSQTVIGLPEDWHKSTINEKGAFTYDYGPGPYAIPETVVGFTSDLPLRVDTLYWAPEHRAWPVVVRRDSLGRVWRHEAWTADAFGDIGARLSGGPVPALPEEDAYRRPGIDFNHALGWGRTGGSANAYERRVLDPAFANVAWSPNRALHYEVAVDPGAEMQIALGWMDVRYGGPTRRIMDAHVEGTAPVEIAPVRDAGRYEPLVRIFRAVDVDSSGWITVSVHPSGAGADPNPFLSGIWVFDVDVPVSIEEIIDGSASAIARQTIDAGNDWHAYRPGRVDIQRITPPEGAPVMVDVITQRRLDVTPYGLELEGRPFLETDPIAERIDATPQGFRLYLPATSEATLAVYHGSVTKRFEGRSAAPTSQAQVAEIWQTYRKAHSLPLSVPEPSLQHQLAVNWDNVYRMVDQVDGNRHYHIGPSVYRGLWIGDATKTARAMVMLADTAGVRQLTETMRQYVLPSGQFKLMVPHTLYRETAIYVRLLALYAEHSGNADWLLARWPDVQRAIAFMEDLNATTFEDPSTLYYGLFPPGFTDGGLAGVNPEYSSTLYALGALHVALRAIDQFQIDEPRAQAWQAFRDRLAARYAEARDRDQITDRFGNAFVPMKMGPNGSSDRPTMAQWAVLEGVNYSGVYRGDEPIVQSTLSMFDAHRSQGLVRGVGWLEDGLWPWVSMLEGVTRVHIGDADEAIRQLYATANHTNLLGVWVEEQPPLGVSRRNGGDVSSATASALHLGLVRTMLVNERPDTLHLLPAFPAAWLQPGLETRITPTLTWWGAMDLVVSVTEDGSSAQIEWDLDLHAHGRAPAIRLHTGAIAEAGFDVAGIDTSLPLSGRISVPTFR